METSSSAETLEVGVVESQNQRFPIVWRIIDFVIGGLFIYAGVLKALDPIRFGIDIDNYKILPWTIGIRLAFYLPWLEILAGVALISRRLYRGGLTILIALMIVFIGATIVAKARGLDITCGCFGHASKNLSFSWHLALDLVILGGLVLVMLAEYRRKAETARESRE
jgi:putative oxidoreductase